MHENWICEDAVLMEYGVEWFSKDKYEVLSGRLGYQKYKGAFIMWQRENFGL